MMRLLIGNTDKNRAQGESSRASSWGRPVCAESGEKTRSLHKKRVDPNYELSTDQDCNEPLRLFLGSGRERALDHGCGPGAQPPQKSSPSWVD